MESKKNRAEANATVEREIRYAQIKEILDGKELTAKEIAVEMCAMGYTPTAERNFAAPRLTELCKCGAVKQCGSRVCEYTGKSVTVYALADKNSTYRKMTVDLKETLKAQGMTYSQLANELKAKGLTVDKADISKMYNGLYIAPPKILRAIEQILNLSPFSVAMNKNT